MKTIKVLCGLGLSFMLVACTSGEHERLSHTLDSAKRQYPWLVKYIEVGENQAQLDYHAEQGVAGRLWEKINRLVDQNYDSYINNGWMNYSTAESTIETADVPRLTFEFMAQLFASNLSSTSSFDLEQHIVIRNALARDCRRHKHSVKDDGTFVQLCQQIEEHHLLAQWALQEPVNERFEGYFLHMNDQWDTQIAKMQVAQLEICNRSDEIATHTVLSIVSKPEVQPTPNGFIDLNYLHKRTSDSEWVQLDMWPDVKPGECRILSKTFVGIKPNFNVYVGGKIDRANEPWKSVSSHSNAVSNWNSYTLDAGEHCFADISSFLATDRNGREKCQTTGGNNGFIAATPVAPNQFVFAIQ